MTQSKQKLLVTSIAMSLVLSGCSFSLNKSKPDIVKSNLIIEDIVDNDNEINEIMGFKKEYDKVDTYDYLIDNSDTTTAMFASLLEEKTITSNPKLFDKRKEANIEVFDNPVIQPITIPKPFILDRIYNMSEFVEGYGECDITCKKLISLDEEIYYYIESVFTFNESGKYLVIESNAGDTIKAECLYREDEYGELELLYRNQSGVKDDSSNVIENNYNNSNTNIIVPIEDTVFAGMKDSYREEYLREALDVYSGTDNYYDPINEEVDFTKFAK